MDKVIIFDIGSHDGKEFFNISLQNPHFVIYAFEPTPTAAEKIREKTKDIPNFNVIEKAVSLFDGEVCLNIAHADINDTDSSCNSLHIVEPTIFQHFPGHERYYSTIKKIMVESIRLDTFIKENNIPYINFIHIDAQGEDLNILKSLGEFENIVYEGVLEVSTNKSITIYKNNPDIMDAYKFFNDTVFSIVQIYPNSFCYEINTIEHNMRFKNRSINTDIIFYKNSHIEPYELLYQ